MAAVVTESIEETRRRIVADAIAAIQERYERLTHVELSLALGVWAPERGQQGTSLVSHWARGSELPGGKQMTALMMLADGRLDLRQVGKDGRRKLYDVVVPEASE